MMVTMAISIKRPLRYLSTGLCACVLAACQGAGQMAPERTLAGTSWELRAIHSPNQPPPGLMLDKPARITLYFEAGHRVLLRLDCNRGIGKWRAEATSAAASAGSAGGLRFGAIAVTRAMCAPPHLDERVARELSSVRSYAFRGGLLYLSPTTDGGVLEWQPHRPREGAKAMRP